MRLRALVFTYALFVNAQAIAAQTLEERVARLEVQVAALWELYQHAYVAGTTVPAELVGNEHLLEEEVATTWPQQKGIDRWN